MDVSAAVVQAKLFRRTIYVKPRETSDYSGLWLLPAAAYGLVHSVRLWYRTSDHFLFTDHNLTKFRLETTGYYKHNNEKLDFLLATQVDNYFYGEEEK